MTNREKQLTVILLRERLERLSGKKVILKEALQRVSPQQMSMILKDVSAEDTVLLTLTTDFEFNAFLQDRNGNIITEPGAKGKPKRVRNPMADTIVRKENTVQGHINKNYGEELYNSYLKIKQSHPALADEVRTAGFDPETREGFEDWYESTKKRSGVTKDTGTRVGAIVGAEGDEKITLYNPEWASPTFTVEGQVLNNEEFERQYEEFLPGLKPVDPAKAAAIPRPGVSVFKVKISNVDSILVKDKYGIENTYDINK